jgi:hypothetical protein
MSQRGYELPSGNAQALSFNADLEGFCCYGSFGCQ